VIKETDFIWRDLISFTYLNTANFTSSKKNNYEAGELVIDASLSSKELNWRPRWSQEDAVKSTINWWRQVSEGTLTPYQACVQNIEFLFA
jgi:nucleoside-diphosphate-sugar epimerase